MLQRDINQISGGSKEGLRQRDINQRALAVPCLQRHLQWPHCHELDTSTRLARLTLDCHRFVIVKMHYAMQYHAMQSNSWIVDLARLTFDCHRPVDHGRRRQSQVQPGTAGYSQVQY